MAIHDFLQRTILGNKLENICWFVGILLAGLVLQRILSKLLTLCVFKFLQKYSKGVGYDKMFVLLKKPMGLLILLISLYIAAQYLEYPESWNLISIQHFGLKLMVYRGFQILIIFSFTWILLRITDFLGLVMMQRALLTETKADDQLVPFIRESIKVIIIIFSMFFTLGAVFKLNVASLIAGLGIGGLAIALAAKESLENLLGSFTIFLDKPFIIGDLIKVGEVEGHVEKIGFRSTRIRTLSKSFVTVPNKKLVDTELDNLSLRTQRRARFDIGLTYDTKPEQYKNIIAEIQNVIDAHSHTLKGETRVRLYGFDAVAVKIMVLYFVDTMEYDTYLNVRQEINYKIMEIVHNNESYFATTAAAPKK